MRSRRKEKNLAKLDVTKLMEEIMHLLHFALLGGAASKRSDVNARVIYFSSFFPLPLSLQGVRRITRTRIIIATSSRARLSRESARSGAIQIQINGSAWRLSA